MYYILYVDDCGYFHYWNEDEENYFNDVGMASRYYKHNVLDEYAKVCNVELLDYAVFIMDSKEVGIYAPVV